MGTGQDGQRLVAAAVEERKARKEGERLEATASLGRSHGGRLRPLPAVARPDVRARHAVGRNDATDPTSGGRSLRHGSDPTVEAAVRKGSSPVRVGWLALRGKGALRQGAGHVLSPFPCETSGRGSGESWRLRSAARAVFRLGRASRLTSASLEGARGQSAAARRADEGGIELRVRPVEGEPRGAALAVATVASQFRRGTLPRLCERRPSGAQWARRGVQGPCSWQPIR